MKSRQLLLTALVVCAPSIAAAQSAPPPATYGYQAPPTQPAAPQPSYGYAPPAAVGYGYPSPSPYGYPPSSAPSWPAQPTNQPPTADSAEPPADGTGLLVGGGLSFALFYAASALSAVGLNKACSVDVADALDVEVPEGEPSPSLCGDADAKTAFIPVVGPFVAVAKLKDTPVSVWPINVALVSVGLGQVTGVGLLIAGMVQRSRAPEAPVTFAPMVGPNHAGVGAQGSF